MSNPNPPVPLALARSWSFGLGGLALGAYAVFIAWHCVVVAGGADSSGYLNSARLLASGQLVTELRAPPEFGTRGTLDAMHFLPQGFFPSPDGSHLTPTYPIGLPLHQAVAGKLLGWTTGPAVVLILSAVAAVWLCFVAGRELGLSRSLAAAGAVLLGVFPVFLFTSIQPLSDTPATAWSLAALVAALRSRRAPPWTLAAGAAFAMAVLVRPTNLLLAPALLVLVGCNWRRFSLFVLGGLPGAAWLAFYNYELYGHPLRSGYGNIFAAFGAAYGAPTALHFATWLARLLPAVVLLLPWAALTHRDTRTRELLALALGFAAITGCYAFYEVSHEVWWCLRFILPGVPALILAALLGVEALARGPGARWPRAFRPAIALLLAIWAGGIAWRWVPALSVLMMKHYEQAYADAARAAHQHLPKDTVVLCSAFSGSMYFYTDFSVLRSDQLESPAFSRYATLARQAGRTVGAVLFESEEAEAFRRCPGAWTRLAQVRNVGIWKLPPAATSPP